MAELVADVTATCGGCQAGIVGVDDEGRLLAADGTAAHNDGTPHDTRVKDSGIRGNVDLGWFTLREYELTEIMRDVAAEDGGDPCDPDDDSFVPAPTLASAWESWCAAADDERATYLRISNDVAVLFVADRIAQAERDLALALRLYGPDTPLDDVFRCPMLVSGS